MPKTTKTIKTAKSPKTASSPVVLAGSDLAQTKDELIPVKLTPVHLTPPNPGAPVTTPKRGVFIAFEGMDGVGKTSLIERVMSYLVNRSKRYDHILVTREPTYGPIGSRIRELLAKDPEPMSNAKMYAELYVDDRRWHVDNSIQPALNAGHVVLADRYKYSTLAFQQTQGLSFDELNQMHAGLPVPDLTLLLDAPADICMERIANRQGTQRDKFDQLEFLTKLRSYYTELPKKLPHERIAIVNASLTRDWAWQQAKKILETPGLLPY